MKHITSTHLANWAPERDCQENFPLLIRRLIRSSPIQVIRMFFPAGDNVILPGFDGRLQINGSFIYLPNDHSVWELGSGKDYKEKANKEYKKRKTELTKEERLELTFVFATPYVWPSNEEWLKEKRQEKEWKDVWLIDGQTLEEWIESLPPVSSWLARFLNLPQGNTLPLDRFWKEWSENKKYKIPVSLITHGREAEETKFTEFLMGSAGLFTVKANTANEALAFVTAAIERLEPEIRETFFAKAVIVDNEQTFRDVSAIRSPMILVAKFNAGDSLDLAIKNGHHVVVPLGNDNTVSGSVNVELQRIKRMGFEKGLEEMGIAREEAEKIIKDSGLSLTVLRRLLQFDKYKQPTWATNGSHTDIIPALLVGAWDEQNEEDKKLISVVAGEPYDKYIKKLAGWKLSPDGPIFQVRSIWRVTSPLDAWSILAPFVTNTDLENFRNSFLLALGELNPAFELEVDKRYLASFYGKVPKFSHSLKEGLIESLILIAVFGESFKLTPLHLPQLFADRIVRDLLENANGTKWCSLSSVLPILSEASPEAFLSAVEKSLKESNPSVLEMFGQDGDLFFSSSSYYTGLLWALENLAYSEEYLWRVTLILGILTRLDPGGKLRNRPINSLKEIYVAWYRQINADFSKRKIVLEKLIYREPDIAWSLLLLLSPEHHAVAHPIHTCRWRFNTQIERSVLQQEVWEFYSFVFDKLLILARGSEDRIALLVDFYPRLSHNDRNKLLNFLIDNKNSTQHSKDAVWNELRTLLGRHREHAKQSWALPEDELRKVEEVFIAYSPIDETRRYLFLFKDSWPEFPNGLIKHGTREAEKYFEEQRTAALNAVYEKKGIQGIFTMAEHLEDSWILGHTLAQMTLPEEEEMIILMKLIGNPTDKFHTLCKHYLFARSIKEEESFVHTYWNKLLSLQPLEATQRAFLLSLVPRRYVWTLLESLSADANKKYWLNINLYLGHFSTDDKLYAIGKLQEANRHIMIIDQVSHFAEELSTTLLMDILFKAATIKSEGQDRLDTYDVDKIFEEIQKRSDADQERLAQLEWFFIYFLTDSYSNGKAVTLMKKLSADPQFFVELVCFVYKPDEGTSDGLTEEQQIEKYKKAEPARKLLESWRAIPGMNEEGLIDKQVLNNWIMAVRSKAKEVNRVYGVDSEIGNLLARYPRNDKYWPAEEICEVIDSLESSTIMSHFDTAIVNSRGVYVKSPYEGGGQERSLSSFFEKMAKQVLLKYPFTASALSRLANRYRFDAKEEDERAHLDELR